MAFLVVELQWLGRISCALATLRSHSSQFHRRFGALAENPDDAVTAAAGSGGAPRAAWLSWHRRSTRFTDRDARSNRRLISGRHGHPQRVAGQELNEFLVEIVTTNPPDMPTDEVLRRRPAEAQRVTQLASAGPPSRLWRSKDGRQTFGIWRALRSADLRAEGYTPYLCCRG